MRKEEILSYVIYGIMIITIVFVGLFPIAETMSTCAPKHMDPYLFMFLVVFAAFAINVIGLEILHALGAIVGGYKVTSINVLTLCLQKEGNKWKFHRKEYDGLTGETKFAPKKDKKTLKYIVWFPLFGYAAEVASSIVIYSNTLASSQVEGKWVAVVALVFILVSSVLALYNFVPFKLDTMTDGYRLVLISKPINVEAYNEALELEELQKQGKKPEKLRVFNEITDYTAGLNILAMYQCIDEDNYEEADRIIDILLANDKAIDPTTCNRLVAQKIYLTLLKDGQEKAKEVYNTLCPDDLRRFIANDLSMESIRAYILIAGFIEESESEVNYAISRIGKAKKRSLSARIDLEEKLTNKAIELVYKKHPEWSKENAE